MGEGHRAEAGPTAAATPPPAELQAANERLLLAGLRAQELAAEARRLNAALEHRALHDALTDLPNRGLFADRLGQALRAAARDRATLAVLFLDLDRFKAVNDRLGHHAGDLLLRQVAARLRGALRASDTVARLHGDEFAVLLPGDDAAAAAVVAGTLRAALGPPFALPGGSEHVAASIGIAAYPAHGQEVEALMRRADAAMYRAKRARAGHAVADHAEGDRPSRPVGAGPVGDLAVPVGPAAAREELQAVNEQLLLAGLAERELADRLRRQLAFTGAIVGNLGEGVCALDRAGRISFANPAAERLLGQAEAALLGRRWDEVVYGGRVDDCPPLAAIRAGATMHADDDRFARRDGGSFAAAYTAAPIVADDAVVGAAVVFRDITERRRAEAERAALTARVEAALAFRTRFLSITAHELRSPLTALKGYAQLLLRQARGGGDDRLLRSLARIDAQAGRMARLIDDLAEVPRIESDGLALDAHPLELRALLEETVAEVGATAPAFALHVRAEGGADEAVWVHADRARLQQVLTNLLTNAVKYSGERREVAITLGRDGERAVVAVADHGIGIPAAQQAAVFEPYVRAANATAGGYGGLGLGLFISKAIVERHGGTLTLVSEEGRGSTFSVALPLLPTTDSAGDEDPVAPPPRS
jgi:diguanylate cyclase (GGDEF)-like protein/PAS domain S-box-containing protein